MNEYRKLKAGDEFVLDGINGSFVVDRVEITYMDDDETEEYRVIFLVDGRWFVYEGYVSDKFRPLHIVSRDNQSNTLMFDWCYTDEELDRIAKNEYEYQRKQESIKSGLAKLTEEERRALGILDSLVEVKGGDA